jgi:Holliday junction resolvase RusA-like endonuclease
MIGREMISEPLEIKLVFQFVNRSAEADVSNLVEAPQDVLKKAGVISDDRIIQVVHARKEFGTGPGMTIELLKIEE